MCIRDRYQNIKRNKLDLEIKILDTMESFAKDQAVIAYVTEDMAEAAGALMEDAESAIDLLRNIEGVEIAALLKQREEGIKVSLRAKSWGGVDQIAAKFGGGEMCIRDRDRGLREGEQIPEREAG